MWVQFATSRNVPCQCLEWIKAHENQSSESQEEKEEEAKVQRWIRSPFATRASPIHIPAQWTLTRLAMEFLRKTAMTQTIIALVNGKHADPRLEIGQISAEDVITLRACPLPGGVKRDQQMKNKLKETLKSKGVDEEHLANRVDTILAKVTHARLEEISSMEPVGYWNRLKDLATEAKVRLITPAELKAWQREKDPEQHQ